MSAENGVPAENVGSHEEGTPHSIVQMLEVRDNRIAELEADNGELRAQVQDLKASDEGHVRARQMDEVQIKELHAENKRIKEFLRQARQILMSCIIEQQREVWIDARKAWLNIYDNNFSGVG